MSVLTPPSAPAPATASARPRLPVRLSEVAARWSPERRAALLVAAALLVGAGLRLAIGLTDDAPSVDETAYLRSGLSLADGDGFERDGHPELHFPPLVPVLLGGASHLVDDPHTGTVALTIVAGVGIVALLSRLAYRLAGWPAAVATAWIAALAPGLATTPAARGAGSEAEYTLLVVAALHLTVTAATHDGRARLVRLVGAGASVGLAYLTRPEGLLLGLPLGAAAVLAAAATARPPGTGTRPGEAGADEAGAGGARADDARADDARAGDAQADDARADDTRVRVQARLRAGALAAAAFALPVAVCIAPYASFLHDNTGRWQLTAKTQDASIEAWHAVARSDREARDAVLYGLDDTGLELAHQERTPLTTLAREDPGGYAGILGTNVLMLGKNLGGWWLLPLPVWVLAAAGAWRARRERGLRLAALVGLVPVATSLVFFVQPRYLVVTVAVAVVLVGVTLPTLAPGRRKVATAGLVALLAASSAGAFFGAGGFWHPGDHTDQRQAGQWLAANTGPDDRVMARSMVVAYYAERPTLAIPYAEADDILAYGRHYGARYLVVDWYTAGRLRPQLAHLVDDDDPPGLRLVHEAEAEGRVTRIFAFDPVPPPSDAEAPPLGFVGDAT